MPCCTCVTPAARQPCYAAEACTHARASSSVAFCVFLIWVSGFMANACESNKGEAAVRAQGGAACKHSRGSDADWHAHVGAKGTTCPPAVRALQTAAAAVHASEYCRGTVPERESTASSGMRTCHIRSRLRAM